MANQGVQSYLEELEMKLNEYLVKKAPALPENIKLILVKIIPWFDLLGVIVTVPLLLAAVGLTAFVLPFFAMAGDHTNVLSLILLLVSVVLNALALP